MSRPTRQLHGIILNESFRHFDQRNIARNSAVVPPVEFHRWNILGAPGIVDLDDQAVRAVTQKRSRLEIERRESAFMLAQLFAVQIDNGLVVDGSEVDKLALAGMLLIGEFT